MERLIVGDQSHIAAARRHAAVIAARAGFNATDAGRVAIVVTELATNVLRHGRGGELLIGDDPAAGHTPGGHAVEVIALDRGPGMANVNDCLRDGFSTTGTPGNGLGAVRRLSQDMAVYSRPGAGTAVLARLRRQGDPVPGERPGHAALCVAKPGEVVCGDSATVTVSADHRIGVLVADGLGHGPAAAAASQEAVRLFRKLPPGRPLEALPVLHTGLRPTRGAAIAVALLDLQARQALYGGIGNIAGFILDSHGLRRLVSQPGTAGHTAGRLQEFTIPLGNAPVLVMYSDGLISTWTPAAHPGLFGQDPGLIAAVLYRDHTRGRDDTTVLVWKG